ncbi:hypothetical protein GOB15_07985 [Sinorhizobium meliloti]|nr:hypothetical protein [Sinorhizobium meliloti]MDW9514539.1 hypothetical protein [Sinorhizobium meliloti]
MMFEAHRGGLQSPALARRATLIWLGRPAARHDEPACQTAGMRARSHLSVRLNLYVCNLPKGAVLHEPRARLVARMFTF